MTFLLIIIIIGIRNKTTRIKDCRLSFNCTWLRTELMWFNRWVTERSLRSLLYLSSIPTFLTVARPPPSGPRRFLPSFGWTRVSVNRFFPSRRTEMNDRRSLAPSSGDGSSVRRIPGWSSSSIRLGVDFALWTFALLFLLLLLLLLLLLRAWATGLIFLSCLIWVNWPIDFMQLRKLGVFVTCFCHSYSYTETQLHRNLISCNIKIQLW